MTVIQILWLVAAVFVAVVIVMGGGFWPPSPLLVALFALFVHCLSGTGQIK